MSKVKISKIKVIGISTILLSIFLSGIVLAADESFGIETTKEFNKWNNLSLEEKNESYMPSTFSVDIPKSILNKYIINEKSPKMINQLVGSSLYYNDNINVHNRVKASIADSRFNLADNLNIRVEDQGVTSECWAFSILKSMETNIALKNGLKEIDDFSERHMDYSTSRTFSDGINENGYNRDVGTGALLISGLAYLTNGQGAVKEALMPFENNENKIKLSELDKQVDTIVTDYYFLPGILKSYKKDEYGNTIAVKYYKNDGTEYTETELKATRNIIKEHLIENGAISTMTAASSMKYYNKLNLFEATAYNCNDSSVVRDHAITIVGWDDNYSKDYFADGAKPSTDGAYIVLNSYGEQNFDNGYMYISYEDFFIEDELYGILGTTKKDYEKIYQYDNYGGVYKLYDMTNNTTGYFGVTYDRENKPKEYTEYIDNVGVTLSDYSKIEIYVNPNNSDLSMDKLIKVASVDKALSPGYHRISIDKTEIYGDSFAVVVKSKNENNAFSFMIETNVENTLYAFANSENRSYACLDGTNWMNIKDISIDGIKDMSKSDVCIKAFTTYGAPKPSSDKYTINNDYIMNIPFNTNKLELLNNISYNSNAIITDGEKEISSTDIIKTGMKIKFENNVEYILIIRGDINMDGKITLTDLSKLLLHYNEYKDSELFDAALKAADMNLDGKITLTDLSQMVEYYNSL